MKRKSSALLLLLGGCSSTVVPESTTTAIGPSGGVAISTDGRLTVAVPAGALDVVTDVVIATDRGSLGLPGQIGVGYRLGPASLSFDAPVEVSFKAPDSWLGELVIGTIDGNDTRLARGFFDPSSNELRARIARMTCGAGTCLTAFDCGEGSFCDGGTCRFDCASDVDCASPIDCEAPEWCAPRGGSCGPTGRCSAPAQPMPSQAPAEPTLPSYPSASPLTCLGDVIALYTLERADSCGGRVCGESCQACDPRSPTCLSSGGFCDANGACATSAPVCPSTFVPPPGWDDAPGTGRTFIVSELAIAAPDRGFDLDGRCSGGGCVDNRLAGLGAIANDQIRQGILGGESLLLIEIAGIDEPFTGDDDSVVVKIYGGRDADDPFYPANNFSIPTGETRCCEFLINPTSLAGIPSQARTRVPARIQNGQLTTLTEFPFQAAFTGPPPQQDVRLERARLTAHLPSNLASLDDIRVGGAIPISNVAIQESSFCQTLSPLCLAPNMSLLDLVASFAMPDIDLDVPADGLESVLLGSDGHVATCLDGNGDTVPPMQAQPVPGALWSCALDPRMADGYSIAIEARAVLATIAGIGP